MKLARITVLGVVQGVGFRPFVYRLAQMYNLTGWVRNTSSGVDIEVEGDLNSLKSFIDDIEIEVPPMAHIESIESAFFQPNGYTTFEILQSQNQTNEYQLISPDIATCKECQEEIFNSDNRRYHYPFTNCTNCGPRFTIIEDIPYDRPNTTMRKFIMCPLCRQEYDGPLDRRFHAQPNACPVCGPHLELLDKNGKNIQCDNVVTEAVRLLQNGKIFALKGLGGFQLACDATNKEVVNLLRTRKHRPAKPFAVMLSNIREVRKYCEITPEEITLLQSPEAPVVLLKRGRKISSICAEIAPKNDYLGIMLPYTPLHHLLSHGVNLPLVMTSGNLSEEPIARDNDEALRKLKEIADYYLVHNRDIHSRYDDSVYYVEEGKSQPLRRARGFAPYPITLPYKSKQILACGPEEKNTFCLTRDNHAFISQHIGDMENKETLEHFEETIEIYKRLFRINPDIIACDMHPDYLSTKYAQQIVTGKNLTLIPVQHHHAHIVSCMVENNLEDRVIGVAFDGTGYGTDGTIWGGEFLLADYQGFKRAAHLEYVPMPGGAAAIRKPYRMALSYLYTLLGEEFSPEGLPLTGFKPGEPDLIKQQLKRNVNSPKTSSAGRLFDAVSALLGVCGEINYSAQAAIELEMLASECDAECEFYPLIIQECDRVKIIRLGELVVSILSDIRNKIPTPEIALKFHNTIVEMIIQVCRLITADTGIDRIVLSGGVFQNRLLQKLTLARLKKEGYNVFIHHLVPCNDGGISLGQAVIANFMVGEGRGY